MRSTIAAYSPPGTEPILAAYGTPALHTSDTGLTREAYIQLLCTGPIPAAYTPTSIKPTSAANM